MKILFISNLYPPNVIGGYERLCFDVASGLAGSGHEIMVLTSNYGGKSAEYPGQVVDRSLKLFATDGDLYRPFTCTIEQRTAINIENQRAIKTAMERFNPQIVFIWNLFFLDPSIIEILKTIECPTVYLITDNWLIAFLHPDFMKSYFTRLTQNKMRAFKLLYHKIKNWFSDKERPVFFLPGKAIFASNFMRDLYKQAGIRFKSDIVIYHGTNLPEMQKSQFADRGNLITNGKLQLLIAGRIVELKGVHTAIQALPLISEMLPDLNVTLTIVGEDQDESYIKSLYKLIGDLHISDSVKFMKPVPEDELFNLFQHHDIYLFPSLYEPFSLTLIHALNGGIPTVSSDGGGNPEIVKHGQTGLLFPSGNAKKLAQAVALLARDHGLRSKISLEAHHIAQKYVFARMLREVGQYLEKLG